MVLLLSVCASLGAFAEPAKPIVDLDFSKGCPPSCTPRGTAQFTADGLMTTNANATFAIAGVLLDRAIAYPQAFTFEVEFVVLKQRFWRPRQMMLWDEMYSSRDSDGPRKGVQFLIYRCNAYWRPELYLGFGDRTVCAKGPGSAMLGEGDRVKLRVTYDGYGNVWWNFGGRESMSRLAATGPITSISNKPCVGDRRSGAYLPFEGALSRVTLTPEEAVPLTVRQVSPAAYIRGETDDTLTVEVAALGGETLEGVHLMMEQRTADGFRATEQTKFIGRLASEKPVRVTLPVEARLKPGRQSFAFTVTYQRKGGQPAGRKTFTIPGLVGPRLPPQMPVVAWGGGNSPAEMRELGFTHNNSGSHIDSTNDSPFQTWFDLDVALAGGVRRYLNLGDLYVPDMPREAQWRIDCDGKVLKHSIEVSNPVIRDYARKVSEYAAEKIGLHPGLGGALICSESRGGSRPSYNTEMKIFEKETGLPAPKKATPDGSAYRRALKTYADGIVPTDDPDYIYWMWYRSTGDGWPAYISAFADGYATVHGRYEDGSALQKKRPFFSFHDPVVRWSSVWGSPGTADIASNWIYAEPDPMAVAGPIEQLFDRAQAHPGQQVMIMTQLIAYRGTIAPKEVQVENPPDWVKRLPDATYPTIPPDAVVEATWSMIAKPVRGIMYHGWGTIMPKNTEKRGYCYTNPETQLALSNVLTTVVRPLGPTLLALGRRTPRVAVVESATASVLGQGYGNGWSAPHVALLQRARLDPRVINEAGVLRDGFDGAKVVFLPYCPLLTRALADKLAEFQRKGGILVGDDRTATAVKPDLLMSKIEFEPELKDDHNEAVEERNRLLNLGTSPRHKKTVKEYATVQLQAEAIRKALAEKGYVSPVSSSAPDIVTYSRQWKKVPYVFAINDKRTFGDYCGMYGVMMEKGIANEGVVTVADPKRRTQAVYELSRGGAARFSHRDGKAVVPVRFTTTDGRLYAFLPEEIADVRIETSGKVVRGGTVKVRASVLGKSGEPIPAVLPVEIVVTDEATGRVFDGSGWYAAEDGVAELEMPLNRDEAVSGLLVTVRDRASGLVRKMQVR